MFHSVKAHLLTTEQINTTLQVGGCGYQNGSFDVMQRAIRTKVEGLLEVDTLVRDTFVEVAYFPRETFLDGFIFRNGFIAENEPVLSQAPEGFTFAPNRVNRAYGVLRNTAGPVAAGEYQFTYTSGFFVDPATSILQDVPDFIITLAQAVLSSWLRTMPMNMKATETISYGQYVAAPVAEVRRQMYTHYQRPRQGLHPTESLTNVS